MLRLANRGVRDVLIVCCDGLTGFPDAVQATWSAATVQTCVVHLIRASMRFVSYGDRKPVAALLRPIYTAADEDAALMALAAFADSNLGTKYPSAVASWQQAWDRFTPFLAFGPALRKVIYTTNSDRVAELRLPQDHQEPRPLPLRRRRDQAALAGHHEHRGQASQGTRQTSQPPQGPTHPAAPARRRRPGPRLESRPRRTEPPRV